MCPTCKCAIPELAIVCPNCADNASKNAALHQQLQILPRVLSHEVEMKVCDPGRGKRHLVLFGVPRRAYCWQILPTVPRTRYSIKYDRLDDTVNCRDCQRALAGLMAQMRRAAV